MSRGFEALVLSPCQNKIWIPLGGVTQDVCNFAGPKAELLSTIIFHIVARYTRAQIQINEDPKSSCQVQITKAASSLWITDLDLRLCFVLRLKT